MDEDLVTDENKRKSSARQGRRAKAKDSKEPAPQPHVQAKIEDSPPAGQGDAGAQLDGATSRTDGAAKVPSRRVGGWGNEESGPSPAAAAAASGLKKDVDGGKDESENDIPVIPDLEETQEDPMTQVAMAPSVSGNRVATYKELDNDLLKHAAFATLGGEIDLKLLVSVLSPEADVIEEDKPWDWDHLFTEVSSELASEWEAKEAAEAQPGAA